ncbi:hypothetical protein AGDE_16137 [Angomonas deanei]|uniref:Uncharacterized protein n=1 Tax=Angomonas deanei TaxID=59799 RepID=A0A7G2CSS9_9TRYP|nr:hypothetical protein AGDE_16137 [Angomonas deanei]CAD2221473.1 hypothetical protein, conserved [Angomonas deanei]|eukprot:EPY17651.1 hypothetical protein AGDE_16137 [Angomonas deanei]
MTDNSRRPFISAPQSSPPVVAALAVPSPSDSSGRVKSGSITSSRLLAGSYRSNTDLPPSGEPRTGRSARAADEEQAASLLSPRPAAAAADSNHSQDDEGILDEFLVVPYPFTGAPDDEILFDDFEEDQAYAAFLPRGEGDVQPCYLWIGSECSLSEAEVLDAYYTNLVTEKGELSNVVRLADNRVVKLVVEEITHEGEEPDALLCL